MLHKFYHLLKPPSNKKLPTDQKEAEAALDNVPSWMDRSIAANTMVKRKKISIVETSQAKYAHKAMAEYCIN